MVSPRDPIEQPRDPAPARVILAVCGDPVVGRALVLLLQGSLYDVRFLPTSSLGESAGLEDVQLLLLTPTWELNAERREALLTSLKGASEDAEMPVLELSSSSGDPRNGGTRSRQEHRVPWPCSTEELERRIKAALRAASEELAGPADPEVGGA